jgi:hypothetical protein
MLRQRMRCDAPPFSPADYDFIMQRCDDRPRSKVLNELKEKYSTSQKRIYQIWRGEEKNRVAWDQPIYMPISDGCLPVVNYDPASLSNTNVIDKQNDTDFQNKYNSTILALENIRHEAGAEPNKSTDSTLEGGSKVKKTGGKKSKSKSALALLTPSSIQTQPNQASKNDANIENLDAMFENMVEKSTKILDEKKKRYPENNLPIP